MKLVVQIPCLNEEKTLPLVLKTIPKKIKGISKIYIVVIDDGSTDKTIKIAKDNGATHILSHKRNMGLAKSFKDGLDLALELGADIVVNTDGDNQYPQAKIPQLIKPILDGTADIVIGDRQTHKVEHFSPLKKLFQKLGTKVVNLAAGTDVADAVSGFRAYSKEAALQMVIINSFSYCTETIIHAGRKKLSIKSIPIKPNKPTRKSRLFKNMWHHMFMTFRVICKSYFMYQPIKVFVTPALVIGLAGTVPFMRYVILSMINNSSGDHIQSLIAGTILLLTSLLFLVLAILADLIRTNRIIGEDMLYRIKKAGLPKK